MLKTLLSLLVYAMLAMGCQTQNPSAFAGARALLNHPASQALKRLFPETTAKPASGFEATGLRRENYLSLVAGNVDFYKQYLDDRGAIIDPVRRQEIQYSTPAFALAAATLVWNGLK